MSTTLETSTGATRVETDQGAAYAKFMGNPEGPQALFCELIGTRAAAWLGLPTFDVSIVDVAEVALVKFADGTHSQQGPAFLARFESGTVWGGGSDELKAVENPDTLAGLIVLDTWLLNCDRYRPEGERVRRNFRNVFLADGSTKGKVRVVAMDHTHVFACGRTLTKTIKNIDRVQDERLYGHFPEFAGHVTHDAVRVYATRLRSLSQADVDTLLHGVPGPWRPSADVTDAVREFLAGRAAFVSRNILKMLVDQRYLDPELELEGDDL
ncbi:MAG: HipA family kinase [Myxococcota bacterium]